MSDDKDTRIVWPVSLSYDPSKWTNIINAPSKRINFNRIARFSSLIVTNKMYEMKWNGQPPGDMRLKLQGKSASMDPGNVVINITLPNREVDIHVSVLNKTVAPLLESDTSTSIRDFATVCGKNKYVRSNGSLSFVIAGS